MSNKSTLNHFLAILFFFAAFVRVSSTEAEDLTVTLRAGEYQIINVDKGQWIEMEGFGYLMEPGKPILPANNFLIALPPGARVQSIEVKGIGATQIPGTYRILPAPPIMPIADPRQYPQYVERMQREWQRNNEAACSSDQVYPKEGG